jgi:hypothetical protein
MKMRLRLSEIGAEVFNKPVGYELKNASYVGGAYPYLADIGGDTSVPFAADEIEVIGFKVGDRVRCVNDSKYNGELGTIVRIDFCNNYRVRWDNNPDNVEELNTHGGWWTEDALELAGETVADTNLKDAALTTAAFVFRQYAQYHLAKETPESTMKALTNLGLERIMLDALETD